MDNSNPLLRMKIIFVALLIGQIVFLGVSYYINRVTPAVEEPTMTQKLLGAIIIVMGVFISKMIYRSNAKTVKGTDGHVLDKASHYMRNSIISWAILQASVLFIIVQYFITGYDKIIYLALLGIVVFITRFPSKAKFAFDYGLDEDERAQLKAL